jgi:hypothetical protein
MIRDLETTGQFPDAAYNRTSWVMQNRTLMGHFPTTRFLNGWDPAPAPALVQHLQEELPRATVALGDGAGARGRTAAELLVAARCRYSYFVVRLHELFGLKPYMVHMVGGWSGPVLGLCWACARLVLQRLVLGWCWAGAGLVLGWCWAANHGACRDKRTQLPDLAGRRTGAAALEPALRRALGPGGPAAALGPGGLRWPRRGQERAAAPAPGAPPLAGACRRGPRRP